MRIEGETALVTGASRGLGRHLAGQLRDRGASVYAAARNPETVDLPGVTPVALDVTDPVSVAAAVAATGGVSILVNNAGSSTGASLLTGDLADIRLEMDTHFFGTLAVTRAFAPQLTGHSHSVVLNVLSVLSWLSIPAASPSWPSTASRPATPRSSRTTSAARSSPGSRPACRGLPPGGLRGRPGRLARSWRERRSGGIDIPGEPGDASHQS